MVRPVQDAFGHCETLVCAGDRDRFLATLFAPAKYRRALFALYAFNVEIARVREVAHEPMPGEIRMQWWRDVFSGTGREDVRANPVAAALLETIVRYRLKPKIFVDLIEARTFDLYDDPMGTLAELEAYAAKTSAALMALAATVLNDGRDPAIEALAAEAGAGQAIAALLIAFPRHAARRQLFVPLEVLARHGARVEDIFAAKATPELRAALAELRDRARAHLAQARVRVPATLPSVAPALLATALARPTLDRMVRRSYDPFKPKQIAAWRRQWLIWRAARKGLAHAL
jgi:phytoene synthase